jgi:mannose/fructose/N-acetylgalactosamine-specific phosphotransferase system component IIC
MTLRGLAAAAALSAALVGAPALSAPAAAQTSQTVAKALPVVLWAVTGAVIGAVAWPMIVGGGAAAAAPGVMSAGAFLNPGAAMGTVIGGAGYLMTR